MDSALLKKRLSQEIPKGVKDIVREVLGKATAGIEKSIMDEYDSNLVDVVTDRNSKTNPNFYREEFEDRLGEFEYVALKGNQMSLIVPTVETFNFSGRLRVIETVMNGVVGTYVEMNTEDYLKVFGKKPINEEPFDEATSSKEMIYLIKYDKEVKRAERTLNKKFVNYPFSNMPPIDIFPAAQKFVDENKSVWMRNIKATIKKEVINKYRGV